MNPAQTIITPRAKYVGLGVEIATKYGVSWSDVIGAKRTREFILPRHEIMWRLNRVENLSLGQIGTIMCRDHKTVRSGIRRHEARKSAAHKHAALAFEAASHV